MATIFRARRVLPIAQPPISNGWIAVDDGRITAVGGAQTLPADGIVDMRYREHVVLPALVNAHTHLELSYLHERIPPTRRFGDWVEAIMTLRPHYPDPADPVIIEAARRAIAAARACGTAVFGDVSNTLVTVPMLREAGMAAQVFHELTGFTEQDPEARVREARTRADACGGDSVRISVAPHAPYSVSAALFRAIRADLDAHPDAVSSVHLGENPEEIELLCTGGGAIKTVLERLGRWPADWQPPGVGPVEYLDGLGVLDSRMLVVHGVQFGRDDLIRLRDLKVPLVSCPRSNVYVGVGSPPLELFYETGGNIAFGTDSLASVTDLNLFAELKEARRIAPGVAPRRLLESATLGGARALAVAGEFGSIEAGKRAELIAVSLPAAPTTDVEEYLLSGIAPSQVSWATAPCTASGD